VQGRERFESFQREAIEAQRDRGRGAGTDGVLHAQDALPPRLLLNKGLRIAREPEGDVDVLVGAWHVHLRGVVLDFPTGDSNRMYSLGRDTLARHEEEGAYIRLLSATDFRSTIPLAGDRPITTEVVVGDVSR